MMNKDLHQKHATKLQKVNDRPLPGCQEIDGERNPFGLLYARHFASIWPRGAAAPSPGMQQDLIECQILWQGNPISIIKTFGKSSCTLCNRERMEIVRLSQMIPDKLINSCSKIHGAC
jgi:hypothetical protein